MTRLLTSPPGLLLCVLLMITMNGLSTALPLNGLTPKQISDLYPLLLTPKSWAFSIWGLIYSGVLGFTVFQFSSTFRSRAYFDKIKLPFALSCLFNAAWLPLWHYRQELLSTLVIIGLLVSLMFMYVPLHQQATESEDWRFRWTRGTFSIYGAWVTIATILNITFTLYGAKWSGFGLSPVLWSILLLGIALTLFLVIAWPRKDWAFLGVLLWASSAIYVKTSSPQVQLTTIVVILLLALTILVGLSQQLLQAKASS